MSADAQAAKVQGPDLSGNAIPTYAAPVAPATGAAPTYKGNTANAVNTQITPNLNAEGGRTNYVTSVVFCAGGATAGSLIDVTITNIVGGTLHIPYSVPTGATLAGLLVQLNFNPPLQGTAVNQQVVLTVPAAGAGSTQQSGGIYGFSQ